MANQKPETQFRRGRCSASIFYNECQKDGETVRIPKVVFQKRYLDKDGEWQTSKSLDVREIPKALLCLEEAYEYLTRPQNGGGSDATSQ